MIQILYEHDHKERAECLLKNTPNAQIDLVTAKSRFKKGLRTLTLWGHGTQAFFCGQNVKGMASIVKNWKLKNPLLNTVELISCDVGHIGNMQGNVKPFVQTLKASLKFGIGTRLKLKTMPMSFAGNTSESILLADHATETWCYVTGQNGQMFKGKKMVVDVALDQFGYRSRNIGNLVKAAQKLAKTSEVQQRKFSMNYGMMSTLRNQLVLIG